MKDDHTILLAGGGTGGHLMPGVALYEEFIEYLPEGRVWFQCTDRDLDQDVLSRIEANFHSISSPEWPGIGADLPAFAMGLAGSVSRSIRRISRLDPSVVVALGGFGSAPAGFASYLLDVPLVVLDQNVVPGRAARVLGRIADMFLLQWEASLQYLSRRDGVHITGNPIRSRIRNAPPAEEATSQLDIPENHLVLLVLGGSQGARSINRWLTRHVSLLSSVPSPVTVVHIAGKRDEKKVRRGYENSEPETRVRSFSRKMELFYSAADLVVSRAGGTTIAELIYTKTPAVLVPYPHATEDHQLLNARQVARRDGAVLLRDNRLNRETFSDHVMQLLAGSERRRSMKKNLEEMRNTGSTSRIAEQILELASRSSS